MIKCLIIKSNQVETDYLQDFIQRTSYLNVRNYEGNLATALQTIREEKPELVICDLSQIASLNNNYIVSTSTPPVFVCTTNQQEFDLDSYPVKPFSVLQFPISFESFLTTLHQARLFIQGDPIEAIDPVKRDFVFVKSEYKIIMVKFSDILYCEGMKDYTQIYLSAKPQPVLTLHNLKNFVAKLPQDDFIRVHRSYVVSINHIETISRNEISIGKRVIPIGNSYRHNLFQIVEMNS